MDEQLGNTEEKKEGSETLNQTTESVSQSVMSSEGPEMPKKKGIKIPFIIAAIVVVAAIGAFAFMGMGGGPKKELEKAIAATMAEAGKEATGIIKLSGVDVIAETLEKGTVKQEGSISIKGVTPGVGEEAILKGAGLGFESLSNITDKKLDLSLSGLYKNTDIIQANIFTDNEIVMIGIPALLDGNITINADTFVEDYNNSIFGKSSPLAEGDFNMKFFSETGTSEADQMTALGKAFLKATETSSKNLVKNIEVEKLPDKVTVSGGITDKECNQYKVTVKGQDIKAYSKDVFTFLKTDSLMKDYITKSMMSQVAAGRYRTPQDGIDQFYNQLDLLEAEMNNSIVTDEEFTIAVDEKGRAVQFFMLIKDAEGNKEGEITFSLLGQENILDSIKLSIKDVDNEILTFDKETVYDETSKEYQNQMQLTLWDQNMSVDVSFLSTYNKANGAISGSVALTSDDAKIAVDVEGTMTVDSKENFIEADFDKIKFSVTENGQEDYILMDGSYSMQKSEEEILVPEGKTLEILKMSQPELNSLSEQIGNKFLTLLFTIMYM